MADTESSEHRLIRLAGYLAPDAATSERAADATACLQDASEQVRHVAAVVLGRIGAPAVNGLVLALAKTQPLAVRTAAACGLAGIGPAAAPAVNELCRCLTVDDESLRAVAALALGKIGASAVPALRTMLRFASPLVVAAAVSALGAIGPPAAESLNEISAAAARGPLPLQMACASALVRISGDPNRGLPLLEHCMRLPEPAPRKFALQKTAELRNGAYPAVPHILALTRDPDPEVRAEACLSLGRIKPPADQTLPLLAQALTDDAPAVRLNAVIGFSAYGPEADPWKPHLEARLSDPDTGVAAAARHVLTPPTR